MSAVRIRGRHVSAEVRPIHNGYFLRASTCATNSLQPGSIIDVDDVPCIVKYLWPGEPCETETWAILLPVRKPVEQEAVTSLDSACTRIPWTPPMLTGRHRPTRAR